MNLVKSWALIGCTVWNAHIFYIHEQSPHLVCVLRPQPSKSFPGVQSPACYLLFFCVLSLKDSLRVGLFSADTAVSNTLPRTPESIRHGKQSNEEAEETGSEDCLTNSMYRNTGCHSYYSQRRLRSCHISCMKTTNLGHNDVSRALQFLISTWTSIDIKQQHLPHWSDQLSCWWTTFKDADN